DEPPQDHPLRRSPGAKRSSGFGPRGQLADYGERSEKDWRSDLIPNRNGTPKALFANAITALLCAPEWSGVLAFNEFSEMIESLKAPPWAEGQTGVWSDDYDRRTADWLQHQGIYVSPEVAGQAVQTVAMNRRFHPIREYLEALKWDGVARVANWTTPYLGVPA